MSFSRLAVVEVQLIMHWLDKSSLLTLARCSKSTLRSASNPFAWQIHCTTSLYQFDCACTSEFLHDESAFLQRTLVQWFQLSTSLLRFLDVELSFSGLGFQPSDAILDVLASIPRLRSVQLPPNERISRLLLESRQHSEKSRARKSWCGDLMGGSNGCHAGAR
jgi:hypothetical protein